LCRRGWVARRRGALWGSRLYRLRLLGRWCLVCRGSCLRGRGRGGLVCGRRWRGALRRRLVGRLRRRGVLGRRLVGRRRWRGALGRRLVGWRRWRGALGWRWSGLRGSGGLLWLDVLLGRLCILGDSRGGQQRECQRNFHFARRRPCASPFGSALADQNRSRRFCHDSLRCVEGWSVPASNVCARGLITTCNTFPQHFRSRVVFG
jgi:hypothetical protein